MKIKKLIYLSALALSPAILISAEISRIPNATKDIKYENQTDGAKDIFSKYKNINNTKGMPSDTVAPVITGPLKSIELPNYLDNNIITPGNVFDNDDKTSWISTYFGFENNGTWEDAQDKEHYFQFQIEKSKFLKMFRINFGKEEKYLCDRIGIAFYSPYTSASEPSKLIHKINYTRSDFYKDPNSGYWFLNVADISKKVDDKITFVEINFFGGKKSALPFSDQLQDLWYKSAWKWNGSEYVCLTNTFSNGAKTGYIYRLNTGGTTETYDVRYKSQLEKLFKKYAGKQVAINEITSYSSTVEHDILNEIDKLEKSLDENKDYYTKNSYDKSKTIIKQIIEEYKNKLKTFFRIEITKADYDKEIEEINKRIFDSLVSNRDALSREINKYDTTNWDLYQPQSDELKNLLNKLKDENKLGDGITSLQLKDKIDSINTLKKTVFIKNNDVLKNKINELKDKVNVSDNYLTSDKTIIIDYLEKQDVSKDITRDDYNKKIIQLDNYIKQFNIKDKLISRISSEKALDYSKYTSVSKNNFINYLKDLEKEVNDPNFANNETTYNQKLKEIDEKKKLLEENKVNELKKFIEDSKKSVENNKSLPASEKEKLTKYLNEYNVPADVNNSDLQTKKKEIQDELAKATTFKHLLLEKIKSEENENYDKYTSASKTNYLNYLSDLKTKVNDSSFTNNETTYNEKLNEITENKKLLEENKANELKKFIEDSKKWVQDKNDIPSSLKDKIIQELDAIVVPGELTNAEFETKKNEIKQKLDKVKTFKDKLLDKINEELAGNFDAYTSTSKDAYKKYLNDLKNLVNSPDFTNNETTYNEKLNEITEKKKLLEENKVNELKKFIEDSKKSVESNKSLPASEKEKLTKYLNEYNVPTDVNNSDLQTKKKEIQDKLAKATTFKDLLLEKIKSEENENYDKYTSASKTNYLNYLSDLKTKVNDSSFTNNETTYNEKLNEITENKKLLEENKANELKKFIEDSKKWVQDKNDIPSSLKDKIIQELDAIVVPGELTNAEFETKKNEIKQKLDKVKTFKDKLLDKINEELAGNFDAYTSTSKDAYKKYLNDLKNLVNSPDFTNNETTYNEKLNEITEKKKLLEENKVNELKKFIEYSKKSVESNKSLPASEKEKLTKYLNEYNVPTDVNNSDLQTKKKEIQDKLAKATTFKDLLLEKIKSEESENYDKYTSTSKTNYLNYLSDLKTKVNDSSFTNNEMIYNKKLNEITKNKKLLILYTNEFIIKDVKDAKDKINTLKSKYSSSSIKDVIKKIDELQNNVKNNGIDNKDQYDKKVKELDNLLDQLQSEPQRSFDWKFWLLILGWSALTLEVIIILSILIKAKK